MPDARRGSPRRQGSSHAPVFRHARAGACGVGTLEASAIGPGIGKGEHFCHEKTDPPPGRIGPRPRTGAGPAGGGGGILHRGRPAGFGAAWPTPALPAAAWPTRRGFCRRSDRDARRSRLARPACGSGGGADLRQGAVPALRNSFAAVSARKTHPRSLAPEVVVVDPLDHHPALFLAADIVFVHELCKAPPVDRHDLIARIPDHRLRLIREVGRGDEHTPF